MVVGTAENGAGALHLVREHQPDVLILDIRLPDMSGVDVARQVRSGLPAVAVLILTGYNDVGYVRALLQLGVQGFLRKTATADEIVAAVQALAQGRTVLESADVGETLEDFTEPLTAREREVLQLLARGQRNSEIAPALVVSEKTVEFHVSRVLAKLRARSRTDAVIKAQQLGLILPDPSLDGEP